MSLTMRIKLLLTVLHLSGESNDGSTRRTTTWSARKVFFLSTEKVFWRKKVNCVRVWIQLLWPVFCLERFTNNVCNLLVNVNFTYLSCSQIYNSFFENTNESCDGVKVQKYSWNIRISVGKKRKPRLQSRENIDRQKLSSLHISTAHSSF